LTCTEQIYTRFSEFFDGLAALPEQAENGAVRTGTRFAAIALAILFASLAGTAQNQDRDSNKPFATSTNAPPPEMRIDINHATANELLKVPGMTPSWAGRIIRFRPYRAKTDLVEQGVVTGEVYDRIKDYVIAHRDKQ
jgi:DNA uptake protein ComE-like DNA-binding protein